MLHNLRDAAIVFDRFHIVNLVNEKLTQLRRDLPSPILQENVRALRNRARKRLAGGPRS